MLHGFGGAEGAARERCDMAKWEIGDDTQEDQLALFIGESRDGIAGRLTQPRECVVLDVAPRGVMLGERRLADLTASFAVLVGQSRPKDGEEVRDERVLVSLETVDRAKRAKEDLVRDALGVVAATQSRKRNHLTRESMPQEFEPGGMSSSGGGECSRKFSCGPARSIHPTYVG